MCGEHQIDVQGTLDAQGSSPHVRGAHDVAGEWLASKGIIPACAGSTGFGEGRFEVASGSSPHVRGALELAPEPCANIGIIPACAGSTLRK